MKKPWEQGYIPKPGKKPQYKGPPVPEGWTRIKRTDCVHYTRNGLNIWAQDVIIGLAGRPWKLWLNHTPATFRQPDMQTTSLSALLVWYEVERASRVEEEPSEVLIDYKTGRQVGKSVMLGLNYGMSAQRFTECAAQYRLPISMDFKKLEERAAAWMEQDTPLHSKAGTGSPASSSTSEAPSGETACSGQPTSARTPGTEDG